jgi:hypothetical protein
LLSVFQHGKSFGEREMYIILERRVFEREEREVYARLKTLEFVNIIEAI